jgi:beta-glucanase (GH16 family)
MSLDLAGYTLSFSEEFTASELDTAVWGTRYWWGGRSLPSNDEKQSFIDEATPVLQAYPDLAPFRFADDPDRSGDGVLVITADHSPDPSLTDGLPFVSGMINTHGTFSQTYGYFEIKAQVPSGQGLWPAFWLLPQNGDWPPEIDVMEVLGHDPGTYYPGAHWTAPDGSHGFETSQIATGLDLSQGFHTYGTLWKPDTISFYLDGDVVHSMATPSGLDEPMYLLAGLMVGGSWGGDPDPSTGFPARFQIDSIRVWSLPGPSAPQEPQIVPPSVIPPVIESLEPEIAPPLVVPPVVASLVEGPGGSGRLTEEAVPITTTASAAEPPPVVAPARIGDVVQIAGLKPKRSIADFDPALDQIWLNDARFRGLGAASDEGAPLTGKAFVANSSGLATGRKAQIVYETDTGKLWYDKDGRTGDADAVHFATVTNKAVLSISDFELF